MATDVVLADGLAFIAAGREGLLVVDTADTPRLIARLPLAGAVSRIRLSGDKACLTGADGLVLVDVSAPAAPRLHTRVRMSDAPLDIAVGNGKAWLLFERELLQFDLTATPPVVRARITLASPARGLAATATQLFVAAGDAGVQVFNAAEPAAPPAVVRTTGPALDVAVDDGRLYVADGDAGLAVFALAGPSAPRWIGSFRRIPALRHIAAAGARALAADGDGRLYLLDVARAEFPNLLARLPVQAQAYAFDAGTAAVLAGTQLVTYDLRPEPPRLGNEGLDFGQGVNLGGQRRIYIEGGIAYVADWFSGLHLYDLRDARRPVLLSSFHTDGSSKGVVVRDGVAYVADDDHGLQILDVRDPRRPARIAELPTPGLAYTPVLDGNLLYLAAHRGGFVVVDISDPRAPRTLAEVGTPGKAWSLRVRDGILYVADDDSGMLVFDISDPRAPRELGRFNPGGAAEEVLLDGDRAYVAFFDRGVYVLDITNPAAPVELGHVATPGNARGLDRRGNLLYVADWLAGVQVIDVADPARPRLVGGYDTDGAAWGVQLAGDYVYVMDWWGGISVLDAAKPPLLRRVGGYPRKDAVRAVALHDRFAFVAQGTAGVQVFDIENPLNPTWMTGVELAGAEQVVTLGDRAYALHDGGRLAELDIADPFQARLIDDLKLAHPARGIELAVDRLLLTEDRAVTLYDPATRAATRYRLHDRISAAAYADGRFYLAVPGSGLVAAVPDHGRARPVTVHPVAGDITQLRVAGDRAYIAVAGEGVRVLALGDTGISELTRITLAGEVTDLKPDGTTLYAVTDRARIHAYDVADPARWRLLNRYDTLGAISGLTARGGFLYLAGSETLAALQTPPPLALTIADDGRGRVELPSDVPAGSYDLIAVDRDRYPPDRIARRNAVTVEALRFGRPKITPEQFRMLLKQYKQSAGQP
ncbi:MAG: PQQ-binding-like beta-propeller repeat protein [Gammaproteobacteria bacterium]|nr:PQQ-binding-like beta-propeller repeat protein [Gammaproteobacteria bacterium]